MIKNKKLAFTLSEALITLSIVGVLGVLVLPGVIKDTTTRANIALLQSTVSNLNDAIQTELIKTQVSDIRDTLIYTNPRQFLRKNFDVAEECTTSYSTSCAIKNYNSYNGARSDVTTFIKTPTLLSNGVVIDFAMDNPEAPHILVAIDLNGKQAPNIVGVDYFYVNIVGKTDLKNSYQVGDVRGLIQKGISLNTETSTNAELKDYCVKGYGTPCYLLLERTGFDPKYLDKSY